MTDAARLTDVRLVCFELQLSFKTLVESMTLLYPFSSNLRFGDQLMKNMAAAIFAMLLLSACGNTPAIVSDFNGDSVKVVTSGLETIEYQRSVA
ncbi:MAG: hypothetical protein WBC68_11300, partial [Albidovulum sp.]